MKNTIEQFILIDIYRILHPKIAKRHTFLKSTHNVHQNGSYSAKINPDKFNTHNVL